MGRVSNYTKRLKKMWKTDRKFFFTQIGTSVYARVTKFWDPDDKCREICAEQHIYYKLKKKYGNIEPQLTEVKPELDFKYKIWTCWLQGYEQAPLLVKRCIDNMKNRIGGGTDIVLITSNNYKDYTNLPDYILKKHEKGLISDAHFSDLIRLDILINHGGLWIDPTCYVSCCGIPDYIKNSDCFLFTSFSLNDIEVSKISNWLIGAKPQNILLRETRRSLYQYWKENNYPINYYIFHMFFTIAGERYPEAWNKIPRFNNLNPHVLQWEFGQQYNEKRLEEIERFADFHKLTYRLKRNCDTPGSFYDVMINEGKM